MNVETGRLVCIPDGLSKKELYKRLNDENLVAVPAKFAGVADKLLDGEPEVMVDMETNSPLVDWAKAVRISDLAREERKAERVGTKAQAKKWKKRKHRNKSK